MITKVESFDFLLRARARKKERERGRRTAKGFPCAKEKDFSRGTRLVKKKNRQRYVKTPSGIE